MNVMFSHAETDEAKDLIALASQIQTPQEVWPGRLRSTVQQT
jgi:hypothetical protein